MKYLERCAVLNTHTLDYTRPGCSFGTPVDPACSCAVFTYERRLSDTAPTVNNSFVRRQTKDKRAKHIMNSLNASRDGFEQSLSEEIPHATHTLAPSPPHTVASPQWVSYRPPAMRSACGFTGRQGSERLSSSMPSSPGWDGVRRGRGHLNGKQASSWQQAWQACEYISIVYVRVKFEFEIQNIHRVSQTKLTSF